MIATALAATGTILALALLLLMALSSVLSDLWETSAQSRRTP